jgi:hypothetical protein
MIIELIEEAREWLVEAAKMDENWWALHGEGAGICLSINLEHEINRLERYYDTELHAEVIQTAKILRQQVETILWG